MPVPAMNVMPALRWHDTPERFGIISLLLHWGIAVLFAVQFTCVIIRRSGGEFSMQLHKEVGLLILILTVIRIFWALFNWKNRPGHTKNLLGLLAVCGHFSLYILMFFVPAMAMLRQIGSGRAFSFFGIPVTQNTGVQVEWMTAPASMLHGIAGWLLLLLILGHIAMAFYHQFVLKDNLMLRMR